VTTVKVLLSNASTSLKQKNLEAVSNYIDEAKKLIERITLSLNDWAVELKAPRLADYINQTETRLTTIKEEATSASNAASLTAINQAETSLNLAKDYLQKQQYNQTVTALVNAKEAEEQAAQALKPTTAPSATDATALTGSSSTSGTSTVRQP
jgi:hypothetical protein